LERAHNQDRDRPEDGQVGCGVVLCQITGDSPCLFTGSGPKSFSFAEFEVFDPTSNELSSVFRIQVPTQNPKHTTQNEFKFQSKTQNTKRIQVPTQNPKHKTQNEFKFQSKTENTKRIQVPTQNRFQYFLIQVAVKYQNLVASVALPGRHLASPVF
jgi:hypothetical protein